MFWNYSFFERVYRKFFPKVSVSWGRRGEDRAEKYLRKLGYRILARNFVNKKGYRVGEIDIVAKDGEELVFVEVKTRKRHGRFDMLPESAIDAKKLRHMEKSAYRYLRQRANRYAKYRFDAVSIVYDEDGEIELRHLKNIFL